MIFEYLNMDLKKLMDKKKDVFTPQLIKVGRPMARLNYSKLYNYIDGDTFYRATCIKYSMRWIFVIQIAYCTAT